MGGGAIGSRGGGNREQGGRGWGFACAVLYQQSLSAAAVVAQAAGAPGATPAAAAAPSSAAGLADVIRFQDPEVRL
jgi:hypothetical protein